ncbi:hypothetical protein [Cupriavidus basilensis]|uniref:hypothetical protein n=1 Tax=Cupriavidus basilensis TaxID=68895 RepID=UPI0039F6D6D9
MTARLEIPAFDESVQESESDEHGFCPCCLLTKSIEVFRLLLELSHASSPPSSCAPRAMVKGA